MKAFMKKIVSAVVVGAVSVSLLAGCSGNGTTGSAGGGGAVKDAAVTMDQGSVSMGEARLYSYVLRKQYENYYGSEIWDMEIEEGKNFGDSMRELVTKQLVQMVVLSSQADDYAVSLSEEDKTAIENYVKSFKESEGEETMAAEGITEDDIRAVMEKVNLTNYVLDAMVEKENVELTEEEKADATCIKVQHVLISTTDTTKEDEEGNKVDMTEEEAAAYKEEQKALAEEVLKKAKDGDDFKALSEEYTAENAGFEFSFDKKGYDPVGKSSLVEPFYTAAWKLAEGEISDLVESDYGYHIIKCVSTNDEEATKASIESAENSKKVSLVDEKVAKTLEEAQYTESDEWKSYKFSSTKSDETEENSTDSDRDMDIGTESNETTAETESETEEK